MEEKFLEYAEAYELGIVNTFVIQRDECIQIQKNGIKYHKSTNCWLKECKCC